MIQGSGSRKRGGSDLKQVDMKELGLPVLETESILPYLPDLKQLFMVQDSHENPEFWLYPVFGSVPSLLELDTHEQVQSEILNGILSRYHIPPENRITIKSIEEDGFNENNELIFLRRDLALLFEDTDEISIYFPYGKYTEFSEAISGYVKWHSERNREKFNLIVKTSSEDYKLKPFKLREYEVSVDRYYNDDFQSIHEYILERLNRYGDHGLVLLHGNPGTGKTSYIRYLSRLLRKKIIYIPPQISIELTNSQFMKMMTANPDSVLIIEDAESIITSRNKAENFSISGLLNISDGLLTYCLKTQIICTFNTDLSSIDQALLRKGRLIAMYEFRELEQKKALALAKHHGIEKEIKGPVSLADIFNEEGKGNRSFESQKIGFGRN